jgi:hypothetical protein
VEDSLDIQQEIHTVSQVSQVVQVVEVVLMIAEVDQQMQLGGQALKRSPAELQNMEMLEELESIWQDIWEAVVVEQGL